MGNTKRHNTLRRLSARKGGTHKSGLAKAVRGLLDLTAARLETYGLTLSEMHREVENTPKGGVPNYPHYEVLCRTAAQTLRLAARQFDTLATSARRAAEAYMRRTENGINGQNNNGI
ncbi:MAG: hypothetical protein LUC22_02305 [Prevotella sp.]|nr:hypothetical protein [Prevotella sp.]